MQDYKEKSKVDEQSEDDEGVCIMDPRERDHYSTTDDNDAVSCPICMMLDRQVAAERFFWNFREPDTLKRRRVDGFPEKHKKIRNMEILEKESKSDKQAKDEERNYIMDSKCPENISVNKERSEIPCQTSTILTEETIIEKFILETQEPNKSKQRTDKWPKEVEKIRKMETVKEESESDKQIKDGGRNYTIDTKNHENILVNKERDEIPCHTGTILTEETVIEKFMLETREPTNSKRRTDEWPEESRKIRKMETVLKESQGDKQPNNEAQNYTMDTKNLENISVNKERSKILCHTGTISTEETLIEKFMLETREPTNSKRRTDEWPEESRKIRKMETVKDASEVDEQHKVDEKSCIMETKNSDNSSGSNESEECSNWMTMLSSDTIIADDNMSNGLEPLSSQSNEINAHYEDDQKNRAVDTNDAMDVADANSQNVSEGHTSISMNISVDEEIDKILSCVCLVTIE